jgi:hypothetical protein
MNSGETKEKMDRLNTVEYTDDEHPKVDTNTSEYSWKEGEEWTKLWYKGERVAKDVK